MDDLRAPAGEPARAAASAGAPAGGASPGPPTPAAGGKVRPRSSGARRKAKSAGRPRVIILGGGPNRIGQGIEFDYCCVQASFALREMGIESIMVNSNPETVSTDYDTSDKLY